MTLAISRVWAPIEERPSPISQGRGEALSLYKQNPAKARNSDSYCVKMAEDAVRRYWKLEEDLWGAITQNF